MRILALAALLATSAAPVFAAEITIPTAQGDETIAATPARVAALDIGVIDTLKALGVTPVAVPDKLYLDHLQGFAAEATPVGTLQEPNLEKLAGVAPDLIIVANRTAATKATVAQVAPAIDMTVNGDKLISDTKARLDGFAKLFGKEAEAADLNAQLDEKLAALAAAGKDKGTGLVVLTNGPKMSAYGQGSRFGWLYEVTGLVPAAKDLKATAGHGDAISHEFIAEVNPDWLLVLDRGAAIGAAERSAQATLDTELVRGTNAWKNEQIIYLPADNVYLAPGGYVSLGETLDSLTEALKK